MSLFGLEMEQMDQNLLQLKKEFGKYSSWALWNKIIIYRRLPTEMILNS